MERPVRETGLPTATEIYPEDYPRQPEPVPRAISEAVMAQIEIPAALDGFDDPQARVIAEILMGTGLRVGDCCRPRVDSIVTDGNGAPYLRCRNHKMSRHALVPIGTNAALDQLAAAGGNVTVAVVAGDARVSRSWLYTRPELLERIEMIRLQRPTSERRSGPSASQMASSYGRQRALDRK